MPRPLIVALVGNPNAGKSTLFNALSGLRQHVGNYPGVTVEMKKGHFQQGEQRIELIDLPGTYSLAARSPDEMVAVDLLLGRQAGEAAPDVILSVVDASNLDRHLYLTTQLMELGKPVILVVNMMDIAERMGTQIDFAALARETGLVVVPVQANKNLGLDHLRTAIVEAAENQLLPTAPALPAAIEQEASQILAEWNGDVPPFLARRLLLDAEGATERWFVEQYGPKVKERLMAARARLAAAGTPISSAEAKARYGWIRILTAQVITKPATRPTTFSDKLDHILTHRVWGTLVFLFIMFLMFQTIFVVAEPMMDAIDDATKWLADRVDNNMDAGPLRGLLSEGIITGVGGIIKFLPQILLLFAFIAVLEDCGYMARAAYLMDRVMSRCGLSGKSFIPLLSSVACAVPGIMATRVIENRRDRLATIVVAPLMSCSARLPIYGLLIAAFLTKNQPFWLPGLAYFGMYMIGFIAAPIVALLLRKTVLRGERSHFLLELPAYKRPSLKIILRRVIDAGWAFIRRAGTLILMSMIIVWAMLYFPDSNINGNYSHQLEELKVKVEEVEHRIQEAEEAKSSNIEELHSIHEETKLQASKLKAEWKRNSILGQTGRVLEPIFTPLGWDWKIGMAALASFPAREVIVGTLGILYETDDDESALQGKIQTEWNTDPTRGKYAIPVAFSIMVFFALCCQCASTLAVIRRETRSWSWPTFTFFYMTILAYIAALIVYQVGKFIADATA